jgi:FAD/FMN-containing dehydrogenase/Fe-S oxidoreductase
MTAEFVPTRSPPSRKVERAPSGRIRGVSVSDDLPVESLERQLRQVVQGEVRFDNGSRALYATDSSNYRQVPIGVVVPRTIDDVVHAMAVCRSHGAPVLGRGNGTSLAGQTCNTAVVIDFSKHLNRVLRLDVERRCAIVQPGCILDHLRAAAERHGLTFGPDPATHVSCTLGGMIGNNSCGVHSVMAGRTVDNVERMEVLTYDGHRLSAGPTSAQDLRAILAQGGRPGEIYRALLDFREKYRDLIRAKYPDIPRRVSGYADLDQLFPENGFNVARALVGTESTCVTVLEATVSLVRSPPVRALAIVGFPDIFRAADAVPQVLEFGPIACEGIDRFLVDSMKRKDMHEDKIQLLPAGNDWLLVEFGGETEHEAVERAEALIRAFATQPHASARLVTDPRTQRQVWRVREAGLPGSAYVPDRPETWEGWEDTAVPVARLGRYLRDFRALLDRYGYITPMYGHFGDGLVHCRINFDLKSERGISDWRRFLEEAADLVVRHGGSLSGEHGDGQSRAELLVRQYGPELVQAFREFKAIWDPEGRMNPGKVVDPYPITSNLRLGPSYRPPQLHTHFAFPEEGGFAGAMERCVGVGQCRRTHYDGSVMCPSFLATREERHTTRGRARMLFEMMHGAPIEDGWKSDSVEEALTLCLSCKGCKKDCPVQVDIATYKAEFRSHYFAGRLRPRSAYAMGLIHRWAHLSSFVPALANFATQTAGFRELAKLVAGVARPRAFPRFANKTFTTWFRRRKATTASRQTVLLWPDTFNNYFRPQTAIAATRILESLGFRVCIPPRPLCCGRPLYEWGMLDAAKAQWREILAALPREIEARVPVIVLEPACHATFKDELVHLLPDDARARRLSEQSVFFSDFLAHQLSDREVVARMPRALIQLHCHQHAIIGDEGERALLDRLGIENELLRFGCCGMAGSFGFAADTYPVSMAIAERGLLPTLRSAAPDTLVLANGFSCREQIEQATGRCTTHIAELAARVLVEQAPQTS